jgi:uncharacterized protein YcfL
MTSRPSLFISLALCCAALTGCAVAPGTEPQDSAKFTVENTDQFSALDPATEAAVSCTGLQERMLGDGRLEVVANVKNRGNQPVTVDIRCLFLDDRGVTSEVEAPWKPLALEPDATEVVRFTSADATAKKYAIRVRGAR